MDLAAYSAKHRRRRGPPCTTCALFTSNKKIAREIRKARAMLAPTSFPVIADYLKDKYGLKIREFALAEHFRRHER